jgi:hypothetical protein
MTQSICARIAALCGRFARGYVPLQVTDFRGVELLVQEDPHSQMSVFGLEVLQAWPVERLKIEYDARPMRLTSV